MHKQQDFVFVLWGDHFDEALASIFVTELREAGLRVKVVGLTPQRISGSHGLILVPDLMLEQALPLAINTICLVIPHDSNGLRRFNNDPRLGEFFSQTLTRQAKFVVSQLDAADMSELARFMGPNHDQIIAYPINKADVFGFARALAGSLLK